MKLVSRTEQGRPAKDVLSAPPDNLVRAVVDRETGLLAAPGAGGALELWFRKGTAPDQRAGAPGTVPADLSRVTKEF